MPQEGGDLDRCLAPIRPPTVKQVAAAWTLALRGVDGRTALPELNHPCVKGDDVRVAESVEVIGCSRDGALGLVSVGGCQEPLRWNDDATSCGAALISLSQKKFVGYFAARPGGPPDQRFAADAVVNGGTGGLEVRTGSRFENSIFIKGGRLMGELPDGKTLLLAIADGKSERFAAYTLGAKGPRMLSAATQTVDRVEPVAGTTLAVAELLPEAGPSRVVIADASTGKRFFEVNDALRHALSPSADRLFATTSRSQADGAAPYFVHELFVAKGAGVTVPSKLTFTSAIGFAVSWSAQRAAVGTDKALELLSLSPLKVERTVHPFGAEPGGPQLQALAWSPGGAVLMAYGVQRGPAPDHSQRHVVALLKGTDGALMTTLDQALPDSTNESTELVLNIGGRRGRVTETGTLADYAPRPVPRGINDECWPRVTAIVKEIALREGRYGLILPALKKP